MEMKNNNSIEQFLEQKVTQIQEDQTKNIKETKKNRKGLFTKIIAAIVAGTIGITGLVHIFKRTKNNSKNNSLSQSTVDTTPTNDLDEQIDINGLGVVYEDPTLDIENPAYGEVTGDINKEDLVEKDNIVYKDQDAANNSSNIGKTEIDDKNGTLEVKPNGDVFVKDEGYEIEKEDGTVIEGTITEEDKQNGEVGSNDIILPPGYVYDENLDKDVIPEHANKYVSCDADYYDYEGTLIYSKGEAITPEDLALAKQYLTTTKPVVETKPEIPEETVPEETFTLAEGNVNADGTYTINGLTFESKADYEQWIIQGYEGYGIDLDGIMRPESEIIENYNQKTK